MKNPKCPGCNKPMKILPRYEPQFKSFGGKLGCTSGILGSIANAKPLAPLLGILGGAAVSGFTFFLVGRALGRSMGQYIDAQLEHRFVCYNCNIIEVEEVPPEAHGDETGTAESA